MKILSAQTAFDNLIKGIRAKNHAMPDKSNDNLFSDGILLPAINPRFHINPNDKIFTISSCFARNIEHLLVKYGADVPVSRFDLPPGEIELQPAHILNEYNAGTILQRIEATLGQFEYGPEKGVEETKGGFLDLFLHIHQKPIAFERLLERRREISDLYAQLLTSSTVFITLGLIECWYDTLNKCYLNKAPSRSLTRADPDRFEFRRMDVDDVYSRMHNAIELLNKRGRKNILITVSPIPVEATFSGQDIVVANSYSKAVLRVACEKLRDSFENVEYFPSFEMVLSGGSNSFENDNTHARKQVIKVVTEHMLKCFRAPDNTERHELPEDSPDAAYMSAISCIYEVNDLPRAREITAYLLDKYPNRHLGWDLKGHLHSADGNHAEAAEVTRKALIMTPNHWGILVRMAHIMVELEEIQQAEEYLVSAVNSPGGESAVPFLDQFRQRHSH